MEPDDAAGEPSVLGRESRSLDSELFDGIQRRAHLCSAVHRAAIADAVDVVVGLVRARAVDRCERPASAKEGHDPRDEEGEIHEIAAVQRQVLDLLVHDHIALDRALLQIDGWRRGRDRHGLGQRADLELCVETQMLAGLQFEIRTHKAPKSFRRDREVVRAGNQAQNRVIPGFVGSRFRDDPGIDVGDRHAGAGYDRVGRIRDHPCDTGEADLGISRETEQDHENMNSTQSPCHELPSDRTCQPGTVDVTRVSPRGPARLFNSRGQPRLPITNPKG